MVPTLETANPGTFLAQATFAGGFLNFSNFSVTNFTMQEAVYRNAAGSVDFYFQIQSTFSGSPSTQSIIQVLAANFGAYATSVGFRPDGAALIGATGFTTGSVVPIGATRGPDFFTNNSAFFQFGPGFTGNMVSDVLVVSTNASSFSTIGDMGVDSSGTFSNSNSTTSSQLGFYSPSGTVVSAPVAAPDNGSSFVLLGLGLIGLFGAPRMLTLAGRRELPEA